MAANITATYSTAVCQTLGISDYADLLSMLPDEFFDASQACQDYLYRKMSYLIAQGEPLEIVARIVREAFRLAAGAIAGTIPVTVGGVQ